MVEAFLFDFDGVIFNSEHIWHDAFNKTLKQYRRALVSFKEYTEKNKGGHADDDIRIFFGELPAKAFLSIKETYKQNVLELLPHSNLYPHTEEILTTIKSKGYRTAVVTQTDGDLLTGMLDYFDLTNYFDTTVTGDMCVRRKPFPDPILLACEKLNVKPEDTVYVEDSPRGVKAGKMAGTIVVAVTHTSTSEELLEADYVISQLVELKKFV